jgi:hypothetical protein
VGGVRGCVAESMQPGACAHGECASEHIIIGSSAIGQLTGGMCTHGRGACGARRSGIGEAAWHGCACMGHAIACRDLPRCDASPLADAGMMRAGAHRGRDVDLVEVGHRGGGSRSRCCCLPKLPARQQAAGGAPKQAGLSQLGVRDHAATHGRLVLVHTQGWRDARQRSRRRRGTRPRRAPRTAGRLEHGGLHRDFGRQLRRKERLVIL